MIETVTSSNFRDVVMDVIDPAVAEAERNPPRLGADGRVEFDSACVLGPDALAPRLSK